MIPTTLISGGSSGQRESAIADQLASLAPDSTLALILEGLPEALDPLAATARNPRHRVARIAPGCPCCIGNLTMRVTLNRLLRRPPQYLFISLATSAHLPQVRAFLSAPPYDQYLTLTDDLAMSLPSP